MIKTVGRPKIKSGIEKLSINWKLFDSLCNVMCTKEEITEQLNISDSTLSRRIKEKYDCTFEELYKKKTAGGRVSLRRKQFDLAMEGNVPMLIWLGKQILGQRNEPEQPPDREVTISFRDVAEELAVAKAKWGNCD